MLQVDERTVVCRNNRCAMYMVLLATERKRCHMVECHSRLKPYTYTGDGRDFPPIKDIDLRDMASDHRTLDLAKAVRKGTQLLLADGSPYKPSSTVDARDYRVTSASDPDEDQPMVFDTKKEVPESCEVKGCPIAAERIVLLPWSLFCTWIYLAKKVPVEWIAYLKGKIADDGTIELDEKGMYFPPQRAISVHVDAELTSRILENTVGSVHSHVGMDVVFSGEDEDHFNHEVDIVVNRKAEINAVARIQLDCKRNARTKAKLNLMGEAENVGALKALKEVLIIEKEHSTRGGSASGSPFGAYVAKGQHGLTIIDRRREFVSKEDKERYEDWLRNHAKPDEKVFRRVDGGQWEDLREHHDISRDMT